MHPIWIVVAIVVLGGAAAVGLIAALPRLEARALRQRARHELAEVGLPAVLARVDAELARLEAAAGCGACALHTAFGAKDPSRSPAARLARLRRYREIVAALAPPTPQERARGGAEA